MNAIAHLVQQQAAEELFRRAFGSRILDAERLRKPWPYREDFTRFVAKPTEPPGEVAEGGITLEGGNIRYVSRRYLIR